MGDYYQSNNGGGFTGEDDTKGKNVQTVLPATIRQLSSAVQGPEANSFSIDGQRLHRVKIVGQIMSVNVQTSAVTLEIDDGTGRIDTRYWLTNDPEDETAQNNEAADWQEGVYVRVFGHLRQFKNNTDKNSFVAMSIKPIDDFNEITFHLLEATCIHLKNLKEAQNPAAAYSYQGGQNPYEAQQQQVDQSADLQPLYATVLEIVQRASNTEEGASINFILEQMSAYDVDESQVRGAIEYLSSEGHLYPTFDEEHFKA